MEEFCALPNGENFARLSSLEQKCMYVAALCCNLYNIGSRQRVQLVITYYSKLLLSAGINDRVSMTARLKLGINTRFTGKMKGVIKSRRVEDLMEKYGFPPHSVYFYDDVPEIVQEMQRISVNGVLITKGLVPEDLELLIRKKQYDSASVKMILFDFDGVLAVHKIAKADRTQSLDYIYSKYMGGLDRMGKIIRHIRTLEQMGVCVGIVTMNVKHHVEPLLERMGII